MDKKFTVSGVLLYLFLFIFSLNNAVAKRVRVAVTPFEASNWQLKRYTDYARGQLEDIVTQMENVVVVERARMDKILEEASFTNFSIQADPTTAIKFGKMVGAQILITGTLLNFNKQKKGFMGFGVRTSGETGVIIIKVRAYNAEKGILLFSKTWKGSATKISTSFGGAGTEDLIAASIEDAFEKLKNDQKFLSIFAEAKETTKTVKKVKVEFKPIPNNCDIEINGVFYGNSPLVAELPAGVTVNVKISKPGYVPWEKSIIPREGMKISPELIKKEK